VPDQVQAEGIGPLSPRVTNLTEEGRRQNRRVEVMVTSTELLER
jgi:OOP family OmpA-OmpF porin